MSSESDRNPVETKERELLLRVSGWPNEGGQLCEILQELIDSDPALVAAGIEVTGWTVAGRMTVDVQWED